MNTRLVDFREKTISLFSIIILLTEDVGRIRRLTFGKVHQVVIGKERVIPVEILKGRENVTHFDVM